MKVIKAVLTSAILYVLLFATGSQFSACKKTNTVYDTIIKKDTVTVIDTVYDLTDGLIAYYNFNNGSLKDSSGYGNNIYFSNAVKTTDRFGNANNAYLFDGSTSYMQVKNNASLNPPNITMMAIVKMNGFYQGASYGNEILMKGAADQSNGVYLFRIAPNVPSCCTISDTTKECLEANYGDYNASAGTAEANYFFHTTQWATLISTYDGLQTKTYINGQLVATQVKTAVFTINSNDLFIGKTENPTYPYWFNGVIDEIRIYNRALPLGAVLQLSSLKQ